MPPVPVPLRILVVGNSMPLNAAPFGSGGRERTYVRRLEQVLADRGVPAYVRNEARSASLMRDAICVWNDTVFGYDPDVVVVHYGGMECAPGVLPPGLEGMANGWHYHGGRAARLGRRVVLKVWPWARSYQRFMDRLLGLRTNRISPAVFAWELRHFLGMTLGVGDRQVYVLDVHRFGPRYVHWIPHCNERGARVNAAIEAVVADFPSVRLVRVSEMVEELGVDAALSDGVHLTAPMHQRLAETLAGAIVAARP